MFTEAKARSKWCPFGPTHHIPNAAGHEIDVQKSRSRCVASACMAWRWGLKRNPNWQPGNHMLNYMEQHPDEVQPTHIPDNKHGFCGLAGRP